MKKVYYLPHCKTCQKVIAQLGGLEDFEFQNIKEKNISPEELDDLAKKAGSYEALFSRRAMKYRSMGLNQMELDDKDYRRYILEEYTFLKRPVIVIDDVVSFGNAKKQVEKVAAALK